MKNKLIEYLESLETDQINDLIITKENVDKILTFEEFKNVEKVHILKKSSFFRNIETGNVADIENNFDFALGSSKLESEQIHWYEYDYTRKKLPNFKKEIEIFGIKLGPMIPNNNYYLQEGVWIYPTKYNPNNFNEMKEVRIIIDKTSLGALGVDLSDENISKIFIKNLEIELSKGLKENIPTKRRVFFGVSKKSLVEC